MRQKDSMSRRSVLSVAAAAAAMAAGGRVQAQPTQPRTQSVPEQEKTMPAKTYTNAEFYDAEGKFQGDKAKQAYWDMFARFGYPVPQTLQKGMWVLDFGMKDFVRCGMAGIFWYNDQVNSYFGHEIFLLPGQMIAEHAHQATSKGKAKMEAWHVRHAMIYTFGEGEETKPCPVKLPDSQLDGGISVKNCTPLQPGEVASLQRATARHFMIAGPEGAVVTEYGTFHDMDGLVFTNPKAKL